MLQDTYRFKGPGIDLCRSRDRYPSIGVDGWDVRGANEESSDRRGPFAFVDEMWEISEVVFTRKKPKLEPGWYMDRSIPNADPTRCVYFHMTDEEDTPTGRGWVRVNVTDYETDVDA